MPRTKLQKVRSTLFSQSLLDKQNEVIIDLKDVKVTRLDLADMKCTYMVAARRLSNSLKSRRIRTIEKVFEVGLHGLAERGIGELQCFVAITILHANGYDVHEFCEWEKEEKPVRYNTVRSRVA